MNYSEELESFFNIEKNPELTEVLFKVEKMLLQYYKHFNEKEIDKSLENVRESFDLIFNKLNNEKLSIVIHTLINFKIFLLNAAAKDSYIAYTIEKTIGLIINILLSKQVEDLYQVNNLN